MAIQFIPLPVGIVESIDTISSVETGTERQRLNKRNRLVRLSSYILNKTQYNEVAFDEYLEVSSQHFRNAHGISTQYLQDLKALEANKVITVDHSYWTYSDTQKSGRSKRYKFNPELVYTDIAIIEYDNKVKAQFSKDIIVRATVPILRRLKLSLSKRDIPKYVRKLITFDSVKNERCKINEQIPRDKYRLHGGDVPLHYYDLMEKAKNREQDLVLYKNRIYITDAKKFIRKKVYEIRYKYIASLLKMKGINRSQNIVCNRNETNNRLDTNITNIFSEAIPLLTLDNEKLVSIDLSNSQFTLLSFLMRHIINNEILDKSTLKMQAANTTNFYFKRFILKDLYFCIIMLLSKHCVSEDKRLINKDLSQFFLNTEFGIFYECYANQAWNDRYYYFAPFCDSFQHLKNKINDFDDSMLSVSPYEIKDFGEAYIKHIKEKNDKKRIHLGKLKDAYKAIRSDAKQTAFLTLFSSHRYQPESKQTLKKHYHSLVSFIDDFKKHQIKYYKNIQKTDFEKYKGLPETSNGKKSPTNVGNASFAVLLQRIESHIFIDHILSYLLSKGIPVLSKHDSILCRESDLYLVKDVIDKFLNKIIGFQKYKLKIER